MKKILIHLFIIVSLFHCFIGNISPIYAQVTQVFFDGFETGTFGNWGLNGAAATIDSAKVHSGSKAARFTGGTIRQTVSVIPGKKYKVTAWMYITKFSGSDWGGILVDLINTHTSPWSGVASSINLQTITPVGVWTKVGFSFTTSLSDPLLDIGYAGGSGNVVDVSFDDVKVFEAPGVNTPPQVTISSNTSSLSTVPGTVNFSSTIDDVDGIPKLYFWDFGDGGHSNLPAASHTYSGNGIYTAKLTIFDDDGASSQATTVISVNDPSYPSISISTPAQSGSTFTVSGTAQPGSSSSLAQIDWSTDRGQNGTANLGQNWSFTLDLNGFAGKNRVILNALDSSGRSTTKEIMVNYLPTSKVDIASGTSGVAQNATSVEMWDKFEATFSLINSVAVNPYAPYQVNLPVGMPQGSGITVDGVFRAPSGKTFRQPGFLFQPYVRNANSQTLISSGDPVWKIRFAPNEIGSWTYQIEITDASGTTTVTGPNLAFNVIYSTNSNNHGFIRVSQSDPRYFEFSDGTPFIGVGPGPIIGDLNYTDSQIAMIGNGGANFTRMWMSGMNVAGSSWAPWTGGIPYDGNFPGSGLTTDEEYGDGIYSLSLTGGTNQTGVACSFYGFTGINASVKQNTNYRIFIRLKSVGVTGMGGFTFRPGVGWPDNCNTFAPQSPPVAYDRGTKDWHAVTGVWNSGNRTTLGNTLITLENTTGGKVYVDEVSWREDLGAGKYGPEVLPRSKFNVQNYFSQEPSFQWDYGLDELAKRGMYQKIVIEEKGDFSYNHISPYGFGYSYGAQIEELGGAPQRYQEFFWRYLIARFGYSRAVHSFEYVNEDAPGSLAMPNAMAQYMDSIDPQKHLATTSFWYCSPFTYCNWGNAGPGRTYSSIDYADAHAYVNSGGGNAQNTTSWLGTIDPITGIDMGSDTAIYTSGHSLDVWNKKLAGNIPLVIGEAGVVYNGSTAGNNDNDTSGIWLHHYLWSQLNPGGAYLIYWWSQTMASHNLYPLFKPYRLFVEGSPSDSVNKRIPLNNGKYGDIVLALPAGVRGWGQKDTVNGGAHFWIYDSNFTWSNSNGGSSLAGKMVSFSGLPAKTYVVDWWDSWKGTVVSSVVNNFAGGTMTLTVPANFTGKDIAVKIFPQNGYPSSFTGPTPPPVSPTPTPVGDVNGDGHIDTKDMQVVLTNYNSTNTTSDVIKNGLVNIIDLVTVLGNVGKM